MMRIPKKIKKVLIVVLLPFISLSAENLENLSVKELKGRQSDRYWLGWAWSITGVANLGLYASKNFVHLPKVQEDLRENKTLFLYSYYLNSSSSNSTQSGGNSMIIFFHTMSENERIKDNILYLKSRNDDYIGMGILSIIVGVLNFKSSSEIKQEIQKKESLSFTPQIGFNVNRDSMHVNLTWRF
jgi:hypothetical protein